MVPDLMSQILRISKRALITPGINNVCLYPQPKWIIAWIYGTTNTWGKWGFNSWQPILCYGDDPYLENSLGARQDIIQDSHVPEKNGHPCPKAIQTWVKVLNRGSVKKEDIIFDPFMGSGTTGVACEMSGHKWFGCELEPKYVAIANKRIEAERAQSKLF